MQRLPRSDAKFQLSKPQQGIPERATAGASRRATPLVGLAGSEFKGAEDHDGTSVHGLRLPSPLDSELTNEQWSDLTRRVLEIGGPIDSGFEALVAKNEWVLVLVDLGAGQVPDVRAPAVTDPRIVRGVVEYLLEKGRGGRITIGGAPPLDVDTDRVWDEDWGGAFGGASYRSILEELKESFPKANLELADLNRSGSIAMPVRGYPLAGRNPGGMITVARPFQQCDSAVCVAPLKTHTEMGVGLGLGTYLSLASQPHYGKGWSGLRELGRPAEFAVDLFTIRPAEFIVLGGGWSVEGDGKAIRHNVVLAGTRVVSVDAVAASAMGFKPEELELLHLAGKKGFNTDDLDGIVYYIWIRGNEIEQVRRTYKKPSSWKPYAAAS